MKKKAVEIKSSELGLKRGEEFLQTVHEIASIKDSVHLSKMIQDYLHW